MQFLHDYRSGALPLKSDAVMSYETAKLRAGRLPAMSTRLRRVYQCDEGVLQKKIVRVCTCPGCGQVVSEEYDEQSQPYLCNTPLFS